MAIAKITFTDCANLQKRKNNKIKFMTWLVSLGIKYASLSINTDLETETV